MLYVFILYIQTAFEEDNFFTYLIFAYKLPFLGKVLRVWFTVSPLTKPLFSAVYTFLLKSACNGQSGYSLNFHSWRHIGHCWWSCWDCSHFMMQWMWKQCEHWPHTSGQSSPGRRQSEQQPSKGMRQIPQLSSLATQRHVATPVHPFTCTFITLQKR